MDLGMKILEVVSSKETDLPKVLKARLGNECRFFSDCEINKPDCMHCTNEKIGWYDGEGSSHFCGEFNDKYQRLHTNPGIMYLIGKGVKNSIGNLINNVGIRMENYIKNKYPNDYQEFKKIHSNRTPMTYRDFKNLK